MFFCLFFLYLFFLGGRGVLYSVSFCLGGWIERVLCKLPRTANRVYRVSKTSAKIVVCSALYLTPGESCGAHMSGREKQIMFLSK